MTPSEPPSPAPEDRPERTSPIRDFTERIEGLYHGCQAVFLVGFAAVFAGAATSKSGKQFVLYSILWLITFVAVMRGALRGLQILRRRRFGSAPPSEPVSRQSILLLAGGMVAAIGGLCALVPAFLVSPNRGGGLGIALCVAVLVRIVYDAALYVTKP